METAIKCAFLRDDIAVATGNGIIINLAPGDIGTEEIGASERLSFTSARCRVSDAIR